MVGRFSKQRFTVNIQKFHQPEPRKGVNNQLSRSSCILWSYPFALLLHGMTFFDLQIIPKPGIGRMRERDRISMRNECGKGVGIHPQFLHTRYFI